MATRKGLADYLPRVGSEWMMEERIATSLKESRRCVVVDRVVADPLRVTTMAKVVNGLTSRFTDANYPGYGGSGHYH